jgi:hypothetical protein
LAAVYKPQRRRPFLFLFFKKIFNDRLTSIMGLPPNVLFDGFYQKLERKMKTNFEVYLDR